MTDAYHGQRLLIRRGGVLLATPLLAVLILVEVTDVIFAFDSIPAIFAVTQEPFVVFTANAFAILGLRAMYFMLADLIHRFVYLKVGLALVLMWVGVKMLFAVDLYLVPTSLSLAVVATIITVSIIACLRATRGQATPAAHDTTDADAPFRVASDEELADTEPVWRRRSPITQGADDDPAQTATSATTLPTGVRSAHVIGIAVGSLLAGILGVALLLVARRRAT